MSVSILFPVIVKTESASQIMFVDFSSASLYLASGELASKEHHELVFSEMRVQQESSMPNIPYGDIQDAIKTENQLAQENSKHIFKRRVL
jgi:hypothetical protein